MALSKRKEDEPCKSYLLCKSFTARRKECVHLKSKYPDRAPFVIKRHLNSKNIADLEQSRFMLLKDQPMGMVIKLVRERLSLSPKESLYFFVKDGVVLSASMTVAEVYQLYTDEDGFAYLTYATQETFG